MLGQWIKWEPIDSLSSKYYIESTSDGLDEFKVVLSDANNEKKKVEVIFKDSVHAYRSTDESF